MRCRLPRIYSGDILPAGGSATRCRTGSVKGILLPRDSGRAQHTRQTVPLTVRKASQATPYPYGRYDRVCAAVETLSCRPLSGSTSGSVDGSLDQLPIRPSNRACRIWVSKAAPRPGCLCNDTLLTAPSANLPTGIIALTNTCTSSNEKRSAICVADLCVVACNDNNNH